ncbi:carboxy-terminal processing protease CtpB [Lachnospiraceae bacterium]|nr:S41 family peptidase [Eubacterium sp.]GFI25795.1 carboxy-terminal processing protease CtpB [Lachnospiraceae bacterium]
MDDYEELEEKLAQEKKSASDFLKGLVIGFLGTILSLTVSVYIVTQLMGRPIIISKSAEQKADRISALDENVLKKINELMGYINLYFYDEVDDEKLANGIYAGLMEGLDDKYTGYYTKEEYQDLQISAKQNYYGIGAMLSQDRDSMQVTITHVYEGSPAEAAGLKNGDVITLVEDLESVSMELSDLVTHIRGEEGTTVHLQVYREGEPDYLEFDVKRANIDLPTVSHRMLDDRIGYIRIVEFGEPTVEQFEAAANELLEGGMRALVLDVRDNPGGMLTSVTEILDDFLPEGTLVYMQNKQGERQDYTSSAERMFDCPVAVLINGNSASASEILAGAVRDFEYGKLIGTKTYGKGVVQTIIGLEDGDAIKLTTAKYFTPKGENIHGTGIEPDIELDFEYQGDETQAYDALKDNQVQKAMEVLNKEISAQQ